MTTRADKFIETVNSKKYLTPLDQCVGLYHKGGEQENVWRVDVYKVLQDKNVTMATISRRIFTSKGKAGWDGEANKDKEFNAIVKKEIKSKKIKRYLFYFNSLTLCPK